jgi:hypothetical protein
VPGLTKGPSHARGVRGLPGRVFAASIWAPGSIPAFERKYAVPLKKVVLPGYDVLLVVAGIMAMRSGIPALDRLLPIALSHPLAITLVVVAVTALIGVAFPHLYRLEQVAKVALVGILGSYFAAVVTIGGESREFIAVIILLALPLPLFRLWLLGIEDRDRRAPHQEAS